jgi:hypothetical protein
MASPGPHDPNPFVSLSAGEVGKLSGDLVTVEPESCALSAMAPDGASLDASWRPSAAPGAASRSRPLELTHRRG